VTSVELPCALINQVLLLCWVVLLVHILGGLMKQAFNLDFLYAIHVIQEYYACLLGTWRTTQENRTTTRHMALPWLNN
jgi:hypothetical protein